MTRSAIPVAILSVVLAACSGTAPSRTPAATPLTSSGPTVAPATPTQPAPTVNRLSGSFDIGGGRHLYLECIGSGSPTIIVEVGNDDTVGGSWGAVFGPLGEISRTCGYNRANLGRSDPDPGPRTITQIGDDLLKLLDVAGVNGPYVFVGGSFGGNVVSILSARHPGAVLGTVFVDSEPDSADPALDPLRSNLPAAVWQACCTHFGPPALDDPANTEHIDYAASRSDALDAVGKQPKVPTIVLSATRYNDCQTDWPCAAIAAAEAKLQRLWIAGNPLGQQILVDSGHVMQRDAPQAIVDAARQVVTAVRAG